MADANGTGPQDVGAIRTCLFEAQAIVDVTRYAVASSLDDGPDETDLTDTLKVVSRMIGQVAAALEHMEEETP